MGQEAADTRRPWLETKDARGFVDEEPTTPVISVTITPKGRCYTTAKKVIERLARVQGGDDEQEPHITLQGIYDGADLAPVGNCVAAVAGRTRPFCVTITGLGLLPSPADFNLLHLHLHVEKSPEIVALYAGLKQELDALGLRTYPYSPREWVPHLTLASGRWSRADLAELLREIGPKLPVCILPVDEITLNRLHPRLGWQSVERFALGKGNSPSHAKSGESHGSRG
jgi:2'-5' RNA ligase